MTDTLTPHLDPASGNLALDDGDVAWADSAAIGCVVFTLRTQLGTCGVDPDLGVDWRVASVDTVGAPKTLEREIDRALRWIAEAGLLTGLVVTCDRLAPRGIGYVVTFTANGRARTARGSVLGSIATVVPTLPTVDPLGDAEALAVARRLARFVGGALRASDGTLGAAFYLSLGAALAATRRYTSRSLAEVFGHLAIEEIAHWERSLGMLSGDGSPIADRQAAVRARWIAIHAGSAFTELTRTVEALAPDATLLSVSSYSVRLTDPYACMRVVILLPGEDEASEALKARIDAALAVQAEAHVDWAIGRGDGPDLDGFYCDSGSRPGALLPGQYPGLCDIDLLDQ